MKAIASMRISDLPLFRRTFSSGALVAVVLAFSVIAFGQPTVGPLTVSPSSITAGKSTSVTVTVQISGGTVISGGVNLLQVDSSGNTLSILGVMQDGGNGSYSLAVSFDPSQTGSIYLQASAAFVGVLLRVKSPIFALAVTGTSGTPAITGFNPPTGPVSTLVSVALSNFTPITGATPQVQVASLSGGSISTPASTFSGNSLTFAMPAGAATGK